MTKKLSIFAFLGLFSFVEFVLKETCQPWHHVMCMCSSCERLRAQTVSVGLSRLSGRGRLEWKRQEKRGSEVAAAAAAAWQRIETLDVLLKNELSLP